MPHYLKNATAYTSSQKLLNNYAMHAVIWNFIAVTHYTAGILLISITYCLLRW